MKYPFLTFLILLIITSIFFKLALSFDTYQGVLSSMILSDIIYKLMKDSNG